MTPTATAQAANADPGQTRQVLSPVETMTDALMTETRLLEEIVAIMRRQRTAVSADDLQAVDDTVFATHRVLVTLNEARRRRKAINVLLGEREDLPITQLDQVLGDRMDAAADRSGLAKACTRRLEFARSRDESRDPAPGPRQR